MQRPSFVSLLPSAVTVPIGVATSVLPHLACYLNFSDLVSAMNSSETHGQELQEEAVALFPWLHRQPHRGLPFNVTTQCQNYRVNELLQKVRAPANSNACR